MAIDFKTPSEIYTEYSTRLKGLKPQVNTDQTDSDWYVRGKVLTGFGSGIYADQRLVANDAFPQRARHDAVGRHLEMWLNDTFRSPQPSVGLALTTGATGSAIAVGMQYVYGPNGNAYQATSGVNFGAATAVLVPVQSVSTGQAQNLLSGAPLTISPSPPAGVNPIAMASGDIADGRDSEQDSEAAARVLAFIRSPIAGGTASDYRNWAVAADPSVVAATVLRYVNGFGSLAVVVTAGTTDIDGALDAGQSVTQIPTPALIATVQAYIEALRPVNDCVQVVGPSSLAINVTARVRFASGGLTTIPAGQTLTQQALVQREVQRAIYKTPPGGRTLGASGYVVASEIEDTIDLGLSSGPYIFGKLSVLLDRQVDALYGVSGPNYPLFATQVPIPGVITVVDLGAS